MELDHVQVAAPVGCEVEARTFYGRLLGLPERPKPRQGANVGGCWFLLTGAELHVGVQADFSPARKAHPGLRIGSVRELEALAVRLTSAGFRVAWDAAVSEGRRFFTTDPWGNRLELCAREDTPCGGKSFPPRVIDTARLRLRRPALDDVDAVFAYASDPEVTRFLSFSTHAKSAEAREFIERGIHAWTAAGGHRPWMLEVRGDAASAVSTSGPVIGAIGSTVNGSRVRVGYVLHRARWGQGLMTEALRAVIDAAFADPVLYRVEAFHHVQNTASGRVMEKVGMRREGILRRHTPHPQIAAEPSDVVMWAAVRE